LAFTQTQIGDSITRQVAELRGSVTGPWARLDSLWVKVIPLHDNGTRSHDLLVTDQRDFRLSSGRPPGLYMVVLLNEATVLSERIVRFKDRGDTVVVDFDPSSEADR
jgi:hypothetical protein